MSALSGICYWNEVPVTDADLARLAAGCRPAGPHGGGVVRPTSWLALQSHLLHFDRLAASERQPYRFAQGSVLTWDGRLDNRDDLLLTLHHDLGQDVTDAALVAAAYERWGEACLPHLIGDWSLALWDAGARMLLLARDPMGNRPLYYFETAHGLIWSTVLDALVAAADLYGQPDDAYLVGRLTFGTPPEATPYAGARRLLAGHVLRASRASLTVRRYWTFTPSTFRSRDPGAYADGLRSHLADAVRVRLRASRKVWAHLSGGWDSSSVVCLAHALIQRGQVEAPALQPLSVVLTQSLESDERVFISTVEQWCGLTTVRREYPGVPTPEDLQGLPHPDATPSRFELSSAVREAGDHIVLSGQLGDLVMRRGGPARIALLEPLHEGHPMRTLHLCVARAREMQVPLGFLLRQLLLAAYLPPRMQRAMGLRRQQRQRAHEAQAAVGDLAAVFGVPPSVLARARQYEPTRPPVDEFPVLIRPLVSALYGSGAALTSSDLVPDVWTTSPYVHRPLIEFVLATPLQAYWAPGVTRAGMQAALSAILPPGILTRTCKGDPTTASTRAQRDRTADLSVTYPALRRVEDWLLVQRGYVQGAALARAMTGSGLDAGANPGFFDKCLRLENWLRTCATRTGGSTPRPQASAPWTIKIRDRESEATASSTATTVVT